MKIKPTFLKVTFLALVVNIITSVLFNIFSPETIQPIEDNSTLEEVLRTVGTVLFTPAIETLLFQVLIMELCYKIKKSDKLAIIVCAVLFSLAHFQAPKAGTSLYILAVLPMGLLLSWYYSYLRKKDKIVGFLLVSGVHAVVNCVAVILGFLARYIE